MTSPCLAEEELATLYSRYYPRTNVDTAALADAAANCVGRWRGLRRWFAGEDNQGQYSVTPGQVLLDLGCGNGLSLLEAEHLGGRAYGVEADPNVRAIADQLGVRVHIGSLYDRPFPEQSFDLIVLNQVIEHVPEPGKMLDAIKERLNRNGRVILAFPNRGSIWRRLSGRKWINWHIPYHLHHFDSDGFETLAKRHGYRLLRWRTITPNVWTVMQVRAWWQAPERGVPVAMWSTGATGDTAPLSDRKGLPGQARRFLRTILRETALTIAGLANRMIDFAGLGDSLLVELTVEGKP